MFVVHPVNVCGNVPLVGDDGDGFAVVVFESHLNHFVILKALLFVMSLLYIYRQICQPLCTLILEFSRK